MVDDYEAFRRLIRLTLSQRTDLQVIGETSDGADALEKAQELQPDLILMDLGLPRLNGMEVTRRLRTLVPHARILIISQESSSDVVQESLRSGAAGYVHKPDVHSDLLPAIQAALAGKQFLSRGVTDSDGDRGADAQSRFRHEVQFYSDESILIDRVARFLAANLKTGGASIAIATKPHRHSILRGLNAQGVDVDTAIREGRYIPLDAAETLSTFMMDGWPDPGRFLGGVGTLIESASKAITIPGSRLAIFGEGVALLWVEGKTEAAIRVEQLSQDIAEMYGADILCAYPASLHVQENESVFSRVCAAHSTVYSR